MRKYEFKVLRDDLGRTVLLEGSVSIDIDTQGVGRRDSHEYVRDYVTRMAGNMNYQPKKFPLHSIIVEDVTDAPMQAPEKSS